jgi:hypothetical protein
MLNQIILLDYPQLAKRFAQLKVWEVWEVWGVYGEFELIQAVLVSEPQAKIIFPISKNLSSHKQKSFFP